MNIVRIEASAHGFSLIEVLVTMVILLIGLLGLVGLQGRALSAQMESYQRSQAIVLVQDMASRLEANRTDAASYVTNPMSGTGNPRGTGFNSSNQLDCSGVATRAALDLCEWHNALLGATVKEAGANVGAMVGARGCIYQTAAAVPEQYVVAVSWQGLASTTIAASSCGSGLYGTNDAVRRVVAIPITIGTIN